MKNIYNDILTSISNDEKLLAILIDPEKVQFDAVRDLIMKVNQTIITHIFIGGSTVDENIISPIISKIKKYTNLPVIIFPGDVIQISSEADALLFLSLISGRNPEYLIEKQVQAVDRLRDTNLEIISTGYLLIENGKETAVERVSGTKPISRSDIQLISDTAKAGELLGMKQTYLEAGSGAIHPINSEIIRAVKTDTEIPLIVGGGIRNKEQLEIAYAAGADLVVIGTAFEQDESFFNELL